MKAMGLLRLSINDAIQSHEQLKLLKQLTGLILDQLGGTADIDPSTKKQIPTLELEQPVYFLTLWEKNLQ